MADSQREQASSARDVTDEMVRMRWLADHVPVPAVRHFVNAPDEAWLLMTAMPGRTAHQLVQADAHGRTAIVDALARFLRRLHAIPIERCPFNLDSAVDRLASLGTAHRGWLLRP